MDENFIKKLYKAHRQPRQIPSPEKVCGVIYGFLELLFPELADKRPESLRAFKHQVETLKLDFHHLLIEIEDVLPNSPAAIEQAFLNDLPAIHESLLEDAHAIFQGDPAAIADREVIRSYPGFLAIAVYRIAHCLYCLEVPFIPRILTEHAHNKTGIDIHPGAEIGQRFCIDHGTGVVIGETVHIGDDVKVYQGVTLGALSVRKELARTKRHPTIEDGVVIYSGATILGGQTVIGAHSVIGGNVWLTESVAPHSSIYYQPQQQRAKARIKK